MFSYKARRLGIEFPLTVTTASGQGLNVVRTVTYTHRLWARPVGEIPVGTNPNSVLIETAAGGSRTLQSWIDSYSFNALRLRYRISGSSNGDTQFGSAQVFEYGENSDVGQFVTSYTYPTSGWLQATGANGLGNQLITTFRSSNGGVGKVVFMHGIDQAGDTRVFPSSDTGIAAFAALMTAADSCARAIDGGRFVAGMAWNPGSDERWFKNVRRVRS